MKRRRLEEILETLSNPYNVSFKDAMKFAEELFGTPRAKGSHFIFKVPWQGDPRINLQPDEGDRKKAKSYQVKQLVKAIEKIKEALGDGKI